jgi:hypothetical protein
MEIPNTTCISEIKTLDSLVGIKTSGIYLIYHGGKQFVANVFFGFNNKIEIMLSAVNNSYFYVFSFQKANELWVIRWGSYESSVDTTMVIKAGAVDLVQDINIKNLIEEFHGSLV